MSRSVTPVRHESALPFAGPPALLDPPAFVPEPPPHPADAPLRGVLYVSRGGEGWTEAALDDLWSKCRAFNRQRGVSGAMLHYGGWFLQWIEGPEPAIADCLKRIEADLRHHDIAWLVDEPLSTRRAGDWTMHRARPTDGDRAVIAMLQRLSEGARPEGSTRPAAVAESDLALALKLLLALPGHAPAG